MTESLRDHLRTAERLLAGQAPGLQDYIVRVKAGEQFFSGSTVRPLQRVMVRSPSGLLLPSSAVRPAQPIDQVLAYLSAEEMFGQPVGPQHVAAAISSLSVDYAVSWAAHWLAKLGRPDRPRREVDAEFAQQYLGVPHRTRITNILRDPARALVVPQALINLIKYALLHCESRGEPGPEDRDGAAALALLCITACLGPDRDLDDEELVLGEAPGELGRELIANQVFNATRDLRGVWAMFERCWREIPNELASDFRMVDLPAEYEKVTGVPLDDVVTICGALWASSGNGRSTVSLDYFSTLSWEPERLDRVLTLISASPDQMKQMISEEVDQFGLQWSTRSFDRYPIIRWPTEHLTVISPTHVVRRASGQWPLMDILRELESRGERKRTGKIRGAAALANETWALEGFRGVVGNDRRRFYSEEQLKAAYHGSKVADAAIDYGDTWLVVEVTTKGIQAATAAGISDEAVVTDIDDCIRKARQLEATINNLRSNQRKLTGVDHSVHRRFRPILVIADRFASGPILTTLLWTRLKALDVMQEHDVAPLEVMEIEDLNVVEGLSEETGESLADLLAAKEKSGLHAMATREYVLVDRRLNPKPPQRIMSRWQQWTATAITALGDAQDR